MKLHGMKILLRLDERTWWSKVKHIFLGEPIVPKLPLIKCTVVKIGSEFKSFLKRDIAIKKGDKVFASLREIISEPQHNTVLIYGREHYIVSGTSPIVAILQGVEK